MKSFDMLNEEWAACDKDWYSIYQWSSLANSKYSEHIAALILGEFGQIQLRTDDLRQENFRLPDHHGQAQLQTDISQFTEKRFLRAMFNARKLPSLGTILDYEVPLKANQVARHGDIDLLCQSNSQLLLVEAKTFESSESLLKALLQVYVYSALIDSVRTAFIESFAIKQQVSLVPTVLSFPSAESGKQIRSIHEFPVTCQLLERLNESQAKRHIEPVRFFLVQDPIAELEKSLIADSFDEKSSLVRFRDDFMPTIEEIVFN